MVADDGDTLRPRHSNASSAGNAKGPSESAPAQKPGPVRVPAPNQNFSPAEQQELVNMPRQERNKIFSNFARPNGGLKNHIFALCILHVMIEIDILFIN